MKLPLLWLAASLVVLWSGLASAQIKDRHAGYYYPEPQVREIFRSSVDTAPKATALSRAAFAVGIAIEQKKQDFAPPWHLFVKGAEKQKMIIVATHSGRYDTIFRLRALLASLTSEARSTPIFRQASHPEELTFLDFCKRLGFERVTVSDGDKVALQIDLK